MRTYTNLDVVDPNGGAFEQAIHAARSRMKTRVPMPRHAASCGVIRHLAARDFIDNDLDSCRTAFDEAWGAAPPIIGGE